MGVTVADLGNVFEALSEFLESIVETVNAVFERFLLAWKKLQTMSDRTIEVQGQEFDAEDTMKAIEAAIEKRALDIIVEQKDAAGHGTVTVWGDDYSDCDGYIADASNDSVISSYTDLREVRDMAEAELESAGSGTPTPSRGRQKVRLSNIRD